MKFFSTQRLVFVVVIRGIYPIYKKYKYIKKIKGDCYGCNMKEYKNLKTKQWKV